MQVESKNRCKKAGAVVTLVLLLFGFRGGAEAAWNNPGVLVVRSQLQLMRGNTQSALDLAARAGSASATCHSMGIVTF